MRRTYLRTDKMHERYVTAEKDPDFMRTAPSIIDYVFWRVIDNSFPYDTVAKTHHMLVPKRQFAEYGDMKRRERVEYDTIINTYLEDYDVVMLNLPKQRSVKDWFHIHLLILRTKR